MHLFQIYHITHDLYYKTYVVRNAENAANSQGAALTLNKVQIAVMQALALWSSESPINFVPVIDSVSPDINIHFVNNGYTAQLANASIEINFGNRLFVDLYNEVSPNPAHLGPYDLVAAIAHEVGHKLGINHPPLIEGTEMETAPDAIMSKVFSPHVVERFLKPYDINEIQKLYGKHLLDNAVLCELQEDVTFDTLENGVHFNKAGNFIQVDGPVGKSLILTAFIRATTSKKINSVNLAFTTYSPNVILNSVYLFDGSELLQKYYTCCRINRYATKQIKEWDVKLGLLKRKKMQIGLVAKINIQFKRFINDTRWDYGVVQFNSVSAEPLLQPGPGEPLILSS